MTVALVPPRTDAPRRVSVERVRMTGERTGDVAFAEVHDASAAEALVGCHCLVEPGAADALFLQEEGALEGFARIEGWTLLDEDGGLVGTVAEVIERPVQPLLEVERGGGARVLVPLADELVCGMDGDARTLRMRLPRGILDV